MFGKSKKNKIEEDDASAGAEDIFEKISREMVTHNMPAQEKIVGSVTSPLAPGKVSFEGAGKKNNFKAVGVFIMIGGLLVVSLIVFLTYKFVIAPTASTNKSSSLVSEKNNSENIKTEEIVASTSPVDIANSGTNVVSVSDGTSVEGIATSSPSEMPEESVGKDVSDLPPLIDSDNDGLLDNEEILFGTSATNDDSDGDGYKDLAELLSGYDPAVKGGRLKDSAFFIPYTSSVYGFSFSHPKAWPLTEPRSDLTILSAADDSLVQISVSRNEDGSGILAWFEESFPNNSASYDNFISRPGFEAIKSRDGLNTYITDEKRQNIIVISYVPASMERLAYKNVYDLIIQSFSF